MSADPIRAALDALEKYDDANPYHDCRDILAAARAALEGMEETIADRIQLLRATADQVFPEERPPHDAVLKWMKKHPDDLPPWQIREAKRLQLLAIAAELEAQQ